MSAPADYEEEAASYARILAGGSDTPLRTVLELGSGGGNNASHLKARFQMVLVEPSAGMLQVSRALNPECEHVQGDMRTVRLGRQFDAGFQPRVEPFEHSALEPASHEVFVADKPSPSITPV